MYLGVKYHEVSNGLVKKQGKKKKKEKEKRKRNICTFPTHTEKTIWQDANNQ
jgi:hypothetical protein